MIVRALVALWLLLAGPALAAEKPPLVLAAASLQESLNAAADAWSARGHPRPVLSFAASSALARQVLSGAPADLFVSADEAWMDAVAARVHAPTRARLVGNRLVLVAPAGSRVRLTPAAGAPLKRALGDGRLALADPDSVPAGRYARAALTRLGLWDGVSGSIARAENVRAALALVERGEAPLGIVYATDARASDKVKVVGVFPAASHPPIVYSMALLKTAQGGEGEAFHRFLLSRDGQAIFARFGFRTRGR